MTGKQFPFRYYSALKAIADNNIDDHEVIDVQIARAIGVRPLPMRVHHNPGNIAPVTEESAIPKDATTTQSADTNDVSQQAKKKTAKKIEISYQAKKGTTYRIFVKCVAKKGDDSDDIRSHSGKKTY